ncbi:MAG: N-acetyl-alpha-D-glucosaminyl L-malate synthase BshA [Bacteroidetes bacterium]|nr:N-acetyl-alpha-D-glucosaminyl L-malate synthase BshA [Bacteroidota bacterium]
MKIGIVCYPTFGGSGVVATELGKALADRGHQVHFISYNQPARIDIFNSNLFYHEVNVSTYPLFDYPPYETSLASQLVNIVKNEKLDVLHVHYAIPHASAAIFAKQILADENIHIPVVTTLHGTDITLVGKDPLYEPVVSYSIKQSDVVTAVSESLKQDTYKHFHVDCKEIKVIPNFIDFKKFSKLKKEHFKKLIAPNNEFLIVHTSNFRKVKRVDDVVKVFAGILAHKPAKLLLIGDGPERTNIEHLSRELNVQDSVMFLGKQEAIDEILSVSDLFLLPSENESFGLAALEAMACEVPVVSSNAGGISEMNLDGFSGFTLDVGDVNGMIVKSLEILKSPESLAQFKQNAIAQARKFDIENILPMYEDIYKSLLVEKV